MLCSSLRPYALTALQRRLDAEFIRHHVDFAPLLHTTAQLRSLVTTVSDSLRRARERADALVAHLSAPSTSEQMLLSPALHKPLCEMVAAMRAQLGSFESLASDFLDPRRVPSPHEIGALVDELHSLRATLATLSQLQIATCRLGALVRAHVAGERPHESLQSVRASPPTWNPLERAKARAPTRRRSPANSSLRSSPAVTAAEAPSSTLSSAARRHTPLSTSSTASLPGSQMHAAASSPAAQHSTATSVSSPYSATVSPTASVSSHRPPTFYSPAAAQYSAAAQARSPALRSTSSAAKSPYSPAVQSLSSHRSPAVHSPALLHPPSRSPATANRSPLRNPFSPASASKTSHTTVAHHSPPTSSFDQQYSMFAGDDAAPLAGNTTFDDKYNMFASDDIVAPTANGNDWETLFG